MLISLVPTAAFPELTASFVTRKQRVHDMDKVYYMCRETTIILKWGFFIEAIVVLLRSNSLKFPQQVYEHHRKQRGGKPFVETLL